MPSSGTSSTFALGDGTSPPMTGVLRLGQRTTSTTPILLIHDLDAWGHAAHSCENFRPMTTHLRAKKAGRKGFGTVLRLGYYWGDKAESRGGHCTHAISNYSADDSGGHDYERTGSLHKGRTGHTADATLQHLSNHLAWFINKKYTRNKQPVSIVTHSMGGLLPRYAIARMGKEGWPKKLLVNDVVTVAAPHQGGGIARVCSRVHAVCTGEARLRDPEVDRN